METKSRKLRQGDIYYADLPVKEEGSVQAGRRPVLIILCNRLAFTSPNVVVAIVTSKLKRIDDEAHVVLPMMKGLPKQSMVEIEQVMTLQKYKLRDYCCTLDEETMLKVYRAIRKTFGPDVLFNQRRSRKKHVKGAENMVRTFAGKTKAE